MGAELLVVSGNSSNLVSWVPTADVPLVKRRVRLGFSKPDTVTLVEQIVIAK